MQVACSVGDTKNSEGVPKSLGDLTQGCRIPYDTGWANSRPGCINRPQNTTLTLWGFLAGKSPAGCCAHGSCYRLKRAMVGARWAKFSPWVHKQAYKKVLSRMEAHFCQGDVKMYQKRGACARCVNWTIMHVITTNLQSKCCAVFLR